MSPFVFLQIRFIPLIEEYKLWLGRQAPIVSRKRITPLNKGKASVELSPLFLSFVNRKHNQGLSQ